MSVSVHIQQRLGDFALDVAFDSEGGVTALFGPSGSGKTSVINAIAGLNKPDTGRIQLGGRVLYDSGDGINVPPHKRRIGYVFQEPRLFPHMSVAQNIDYGRRNQLYSTPNDGGLPVLGIAHLMERYPRDLSGGEAQRVAIARALTIQPEVLLMDDPLAALDDTRKAEFLPYLQAFVAKTSIPVFYVSHAMSEVAQLADHLVVMREGRVARSGALGQILSDPAAISDIGVREAGAILNVRVTGDQRGAAVPAARAGRGRGDAAGSYPCQRRDVVKRQAGRLVGSEYSALHGDAAARRAGAGGGCRPALWRGYVDGADHAAVGAGYGASGGVELLCGDQIRRCGSNGPWTARGAGRDALTLLPRSRGAARVCPCGLVSAHGFADNGCNP